MNCYDIKFLINLDEYDDSVIKNVLNNSKNIFNWQFDKNFDAKIIEEDINFQTRDVSNFENEKIEKIIHSFFNFTFDEVIDVPLYKFLVLKNNKKLKILANISSLIFDYTSINDFYELFDDLNKSYPKYDLYSHYSNVKDYLNSSGFKKDFNYWKKHISNASTNAKFHNLKQDKYKSQIINTPKDSVLSFIKNNNCSLFDFYGSIFSLYLSYIDRLKGCLLKTIIPSDNSNLFDKNTLLKIDVKDNDSFSDLLNEFNSSFKNALNHTKIDIDNYLDENFSYYSIYNFKELNKNITIYNGENSALTLNIYENSIELIYNCDLFSDVYIEHMIGNIESLINNILNSPNQLICDIDILSNEEKALLSDYCKGKTVEFDKNKYLSNAFRENAIKYPDAIAVDDGINKITFGELEKSSNSIANDLHELYDIGLGSRVALMLPRTYHVPELMLALNKIGATFIPIDIFYPIKRIEYMLNMSQTEYIVTTKEIANSFDLKEEIIPIEDLNRTNNVDVDIVTRGDDLFTIIFTSGTTGLPKGVMVSNNQIPGVGTSFKEIFNYSQGDVIGHYLGFTFVAGFVIYAALYYGGCCRIFNEKEQKDSLLLIKELKEKHMNSLILPPSIGIPIYENEDLQLDYLVLAGAKLNELSKKERQTRLINFYGTTEIICGVTKTYDLKDIKDNNVPLGRPVANTWIYILDDNNNQMPIGVPGEICVSNNYISPGYLNNQELTDEVFIDNPYSTCEDNKIIYRTGDIGFYNFDGEIEIIGREDDQLSVRGFRIESKEILNIINSFKEISDVYIDVDNDNLIMYYTANDDLIIEDVKEALKTELPDYMIPSLFIKLDKIPLNINGKIDKNSLKAVINNEDIEIDDEVLRCVVDAFKEVLNLDFVSIDDDFVSLGGNSLSAMKLQLILKEKLNIRLSSNEIISLSTPKDIANHVKFNLDDYLMVDESKYSFNELCPLSESQLNVYLDEMVNDMGTGYNNSFKIDFDDKYSVEEIKNALNKLIEVYPILKARIVANSNNLSECIFDANVEIKEGTLDDINSFVRPFELDKSLSRFLIVSDELSTSLCIDIHHLIFDGTSLNILLDKLYSLLNNEDVDFVDNGILRQITFEKNLDSKYLNDAQQFLDEMLADRDKAYDLLPSIDKDNQFEYIDTFKMDNEILSSFLQNKSLTHNQFFASVFAYTLSRFTGSSKVLFNLLEDGRGHIDLSESVGMFVKTLPLLIDCKNQSVDSFLDYSSTLINSVMQYDLYPFYVLVNEYDLNTNISFQYAHDIFKNVAVHQLKHDLQRDLSFYIFNMGHDEMEIRIFFSDKYSKEFIGQFLNVYKSILKSIMDVEELSDINYTPASDLKLLDSYNETENALEYNDILDAFNENLSKYPNNKLVTYNDNSYTYSQGAFIADKIAKSLSDLGVENQDSVAFLVERSELYMFNILGILSVGAVYVPLDDTQPDSRIKFILEDTNPKVVIVSDETYNRVMELSENITLLNVSNILKKDLGRLSNLPVVCDDLACIFYTSGTTGVPKGVKVTRKAVINFTHNYIEKYELSQNDIIALFASIGFDVSMESIFSSIYAGACLNIIPNDIKLNMNGLNKHFIENGVTYAHLPAQVAKLFINQNNTSLKLLCTGGEKLGEIETTPTYRFVDTYGPTETFIDVTSINVSDKVDSSSIGHLFDNTKAYVLDEEMRRVTVGAVGELYLAGHQVAKGYLNRPKETDEAFLDNPFEDNDDYSVIYRTGDLVRVLSDGSLAIAGRKDRQVKIRGNRVELSEIEAVIREIDFIEDLTVQTVENGTNNELVAYVTTSNEMDNDELKEAISSFVDERKPEYMIPSYVIKLDNIPLNVNGKVDKHALPKVDFDSLYADYVAPTNEKEKKIVEAFEKVFDLDRIGIYDDFTRLGGDSLTAIKLLSYLNDYNITAADIMSLRTPYAIANNISEISLDLDIYSLETGCPLNEPQLNVYLDIIAKNKFDSYLIPLIMDISKEYDINRIQDTLDIMFETHPILRMHVSDEFDVPYLVKGPKPDIRVENNFDENSAMEYLAKPFDLHNSLSRFLIVENDDCYSLFAVFNHIIFDRMSSSVFKQDFLKILDGEAVDVDDSFLKSSAFAKQISDTEEYVNAHKFYDKMLTDSNDAGLLLESVSSDGPGVSERDLGIDNNLLKSFLDRLNVSENVLFTSIFAYTLSRFVGSDKVLFNIYENGRDRFNNYNSIGMFVNTLPLLVDCKNQDVSSFFEYMSDLTYNVMSYNYYPFRLLANEYDLDSSISFQYFPEWIKIDNESGETKFKIDQDTMVYAEELINDFNAGVIQRGENYILNIMYSEKYSKDLIDRFVESYKSILSQIMNVERLSEIDFVSKSDIEILDSYNQTAHKFAHDDILDQFNDNLKSCKNNLLVGYENASYTHGEGAFIVNEIASKLLDLGVEKQNFVGLFVERSEWFLLAPMATLSVGCIYVPVDVTYPDERIKFMLTDTDVNVVIVADETERRMLNIIDENNLDIKVLNVSGILDDEIGSSNYINRVDVDDKDVACVLYTSGTTGVPKGVLVTRKAVNNLVSWYVEETNFTSDDIYGMHCSYVFDMHVHGLYSSVITGGGLYVVPEDIRLDLKAFNDYFVEHNCTHTFITSQVGKLFAESGMDTTIKLLCFGGMKLGELNAPDSIGSFESYGPSENLAISTSIFANKRMHHSSIGRFISNVKGYVLDNQQRRLPIGAVGELYLAGAQLTPRYLNRKDENEKAFFENTFDDEEGYERLYRTGDVVRFLPDGTLGIVGRRDSQVKIRGNRVELSEVEYVINNIDYLDECTVQVTTHEGNNELVAYVVVNNDLDGDELIDAVRSYVEDREPAYMVPSFVVRLDEIPLNVNGKVDKRALPEVDFGLLHADYVAPRNEKEKEIVEAFEKALNIDKISIYDDFIRLGGDSMTAIKLLSYIDSDDITMVDILNFRTPEAIAKNITDLSFDLDIYSLESGCPLNAAQINVLADVTIYNKDNAYHVHNYIKIPKKYSLENITDALDGMLNAHPILGMRLTKDYEVNEENNMSTTQLLKDSISIAKKFGIKDIMGIVKSYGLRNVKGLYNMLITAMKLLKGEYPYLKKGPKPPISIYSNFDRDIIFDFASESLDLYEHLSKFMIIESETSYYLFYVIHHIIFDATSMGVFDRDFQTLLDGGSIDLDDTFLKASAFTHHIKNTDKFDEASEFYGSMLADVNEAGVLLEDNPSEGYNMTQYELNIDKKALKTYLKNNGISENILFTSAFAYSLSQFVASDKVIFTMIENGRDRFGDNFIDMTSNVMPLLIDCKNQSINSYIDNVSEIVYGAMKHSYYPILLLYQKYNFEVNILFHYVPNRISHEIEDIEDINSSEIINEILNTFGDFITEFFVELMQYGENYTLVIVNSNKYSDKMVEDFKNTFISVLSNIINADVTDNLSNLLK
ncbi:amino acid adenylation domain-containing protein [Methanobrevibacter sp.]|uniref:amino acid adenylation domain-containing protein n=1 Tax=Methanobrevibacter sp. TaxID=66852 RepID=UPI00388D650B